MTNHFTQEEAVALAMAKCGDLHEGLMHMSLQQIHALCNAAVDAKLAKAGAHGDGNRCEHGVWAADHCYRCEATHPQASEPAPSAAGEREEVIKDLGLLAEKFSAGWHEGIEIDASDIMLMNQAAALLEAQPKREPLTEAEALRLIADNQDVTEPLQIIRIIEAAHKIGGQG